jgi:hypothetical protein
MWFDFVLMIKTLISSITLASLSYLLMDPYGWKPCPSLAGALCVTKAIATTFEFYHDFVPKEDQATMHVLEAEVKLVREFKKMRKLNSRWGA